MHVDDSSNPVFGTIQYTMHETRSLTVTADHVSGGFHIEYSSHVMGNGAGQPGGTSFTFQNDGMVDLDMDIGIANSCASSGTIHVTGEMTYSVSTGRGGAGSGDYATDSTITGCNQASAS